VIAFPAVPVEPLLEFIAKLPDEDVGVHNARRQGIAHAARLLPVTKRTIHRWKLAGHVPVWSADRLACAIGLHPSEIWGQFWWGGGAP
jgi:hypothetical protein